MITNIIPWFESIPLGTRARGSAITGRSLWYSTPQEEAITLFGFHLVISFLETQPQFTIQLCESRQPDIWTPFYFAPIEAVAGVGSGGVSPVRMLPSPYVIAPGRRIQIALNVPTYFFPAGNPRDTLTLVGLRDLKGGLYVAT